MCFSGKEPNLKTIRYERRGLRRGNLVMEDEPVWAVLASKTVKQIAAEAAPAPWICKRFDCTP